MIEFRQQIKELVTYILNPEERDEDVIENYTDTVMLACEEYHIKQLKLYGVVWRSGQLNIAEHQESVIKSLNDLKKRYPNKTDYRIASNCGTIQYFVDNELVYEVNI